VEAEGAALLALLDPVAGLALRQSEATAERLLTLAAASSGLAAFAFLHFAGHAAHDRLTGRLSGLALYDRELWLDELARLAPLPPLVCLSACSGGQSLFFPGDEPLGLTPACLAAGAQAVVASRWPIADEHAAALMPLFYRRYLAGATPAEALALAQREAIAAGLPYAGWAAFACFGLSA
jgi:CHAT domain-containing protein